MTGGVAGEASGLTEDELVAAIRRILSGGAPEVVIGPGDDAAVVRMGSGLMILTVDMMVEGIHFVRGGISAHDLGRKAVATNVSDVAAMGGSPRYGLTALAVPEGVEASWVVELYGGMREAADEYAMALVGGDTSRSERIVVSVTVTGEAPPGGAVGRSGARPGDRVVVTGTLGAASGGLLLSRADPHVVAAALPSEWAQTLLGAHVRPVARVGEGQSLARCGVTAMMDVSDGLSKDLGRLCRASGVGATLSLTDVPVAPALGELDALLGADGLRLALEGGEDYELLATIPQKALGQAQATLQERFATRLTDIGIVTEGEGLTAVDGHGSVRPLEERGWDHLAG